VNLTLVVLIWLSLTSTLSTTMASHRVCSEACLQTLDRWMGTFGGWSQKPQLSLSNVGWAHDLFTPMDANMRIEIKNRARNQDKEMVRKTISKTGGKKHVFLCFGIIIKSFVFGDLQGN